MRSAQQKQTRPRAAHLGPERRRPLVLDAALRLFVDHGYRGTSMEGIADAAGVTKPVVYRCYPNKEKLFRALLDREEKRLLREIEKAFPAQLDPREFEAALAGTLLAVFQAAREAPDSWRVVFVSEHGSEHAVSRRMRRARGSVVARTTDVVKPVLEEGGVSDAARKAPILAEMLTSVAESGVRLLLADGEDRDPEELAAFLARVVARGLAAA